MNPESRIIIELEKLSYEEFIQLYEFMKILHDKFIAHEELYLYRDLISISFINSTKEFIVTFYNEEHQAFIDLTYKDLVEDNIRYLR